MAGWSKRQRTTAWSVVLTVGGTLLLGGAAVLVERSRDTDLGDGLRDVHSKFLGTGDAAFGTLRFTEVAREWALEFHHAPYPRTRSLPEDTGSGVGLADLDGDDDLDVVVLDCVTQGDGASCRLFFAEGGRFREATLDAGLGAFTSESMGVTAADFDADGDVDLYVTNRGPNWLFVNDGAGRFREVAAERGVADPLWSTGATWGDFDRDGHLDLYVCNYVHWTPGPEPEARPEAVGKALMPMRLNPNAFDPQPNRLYRARGDGTFEDIAEQAGVEDAGGRSLATTFCDLDGDGWLDLYVNNDVSANRLFLGGASDGGFVDVSMRTGTADPRGSMGLSVAEVGAMQGAGDGLPDLFLTHWVAQENALYLSTVRKEGQLEYRDRTRAFGLAERSLDAVGWGTAFADLDLDGHVDIAVANGSTLEQRDDPSQLVAQVMFLFRSDGERFRDVAAVAGPVLAEAHRARGLAAGDIDGDGDIDLLVTRNRGTLLVLRNDSVSVGRAVHVRLVGPPAACFGARIALTVDGRTQYRWYGADASFLSTHGTDAVFGVPAETSSVELEVRFADGTTDAASCTADPLLVVTHPARCQVGSAPGFPPSSR